ncbi:NAD(P)/FAD-dependent oxidoreductase [Streptacidiphilus jiangxiensis]|uniref:Assimilatory nitrate reductase electron transfer subunit n=1 Tax=Streptacidiphilus jiangxiensis TaxID=235985 RepID=A0A1H7SVH7_STRJI|nr:FAD-dependent oxidoreductase [Streptacidiphilus jiangxiensis]SEL76309.1 assimilatory nitrate reductase electron transfer subunit [Streptacidiphilus jiangxiensis]
MSKRHVAVVGAGMAAARFAERYAALGGAARVTLYGAEPRAPYNRVLLADVLTGRYDAEAIALPLGDAELRPGTEVVGLDLGARLLTLADGSTEAYDDLVLATGANPVLPPIRGLRRVEGAGQAQGLRDGVHALRTLADCARLAEEAVDAKRAVVVGGGVLGVSTARALAALGPQVEIVHQGPHLIERQLDAEAATALRGALRSLGVEVYLGNRARALTEAGEVELANGYRLPTDLVVLACGVRPRTGLAHAAGLAVGRGVLVDDTLAASAPHVYAIGDCAEHAGVVHGLAGPGWEQADVLAARLSGADPDARYHGSRPLARLSAGPIEYAAFGEVHLDPAGPDGDDVDELRLTDATRGSYKKLVMRGDRLVGAILLGDLATVGDLARALERDDAHKDSPLHLLTTTHGAF